MTYILQFFQSLKEAAERQQHECQSTESDQLAQFRETSTPLIDRLEKLIASIPEEERNVPRPLEFFRTRLRGVEGRGAHPGQVGEALRKLGFTRKRAWSAVDDGFRALWMPPTNS